MKKYSLFLVCLVFSVVAMAQKPVATFSEKVFDFGKINEKDGSVTHVFEFTNKGNSPLVVSRVQTSCGCTTPSWTKEPVEPGKKGSITVTFDVRNKTIFEKQIMVYTNDTAEPIMLVIKGEVIPVSKQAEAASKK
ncbi:protein of unknown function DUF1573 [Paludibacter propionicigenes WB4]|uniref:DUF1573 domain-containing protein n=1 Tax=Paludibacter propionicigenes (strain DSM 17365 / JCM 13257 / WB4) TaxID=694427 RepID=E4T165_PALPW|nr:DUF1573 domain-containing protein [Paludibacter propionicigenes]ADQ78446.1 protein of unknown function DUF1573 [Paludibacter propionicigenes WB4]